MVRAPIVAAVLLAAGCASDPASTQRGATQPTADQSLVPLQIKHPPHVFDAGIGAPNVGYAIREIHRDPQYHLNPGRFERLLSSDFEREPVMVPAGTKNVALGKPVRMSGKFSIIGEPAQVTDGAKSGGLGDLFEMGPGVQWIQIDLKKAHRIYAIALWHYYPDVRIYQDVIIRVSNDAQFEGEYATVFNNDHDDSAGFGKGGDFEYVESYHGRVIEVDGAKGRYVRCYTNGSTANRQNHYIEVEVYGVPVGEGSG